MNNAKKWKKTIEWKRLEISSNWRIKRTFHARMGTLRDRNGKDLIEAEEIENRWQEYTKYIQNIQKSLNDPENQDAIVTHLEPDILKCEVQWALGSITMNKVSGDVGIPIELFQIIKDDAVKVMH